MANKCAALLVSASLLTILAFGCSDGDGTTTPLPVDNTTQWTSTNPSEPGAATWEPLILDTAMSITIPAPAQNLDASTQSELTEIRNALAAPTSLQRSRVAKWNHRNQSRIWREQFLNDYILRSNVGVPSMARIYAGLELAMNDATQAAWAHQYLIKRARPFQLDSRITPLVATPDNPSYPSDRAAAAGAAERMLSYFFPTDADKFAELADEAVNAQVEGGLNLRSDVVAGRALGRQVANQVIAALEADGRSATALDHVLNPTPRRSIESQLAVGFPTDLSNATYGEVMRAIDPIRNGTQYDDGIGWTHATPMDPNAGSWQPLSMPKAALDAITLTAPPANSAPETIADMDEVKESIANQNFYTNNIVAKYAYDPPGIWFMEALDKQLANSDWSTPRVARAQALMVLAIHDGLIACWREKYIHMKPRPAMLDAEMRTVIATPPHPSFPSGHATCGGVGDRILRVLFPATANEYQHLFHENNNARVWGGVHYRYDMTAGNSVGQRVADHLLDAYWVE